jgi:hypothetical protein
MPSELYQDFLSLSQAASSSNIGPFRAHVVPGWRSRSKVQLARLSAETRLTYHIPSIPDVARCQKQYQKDKVVPGLEPGF